MKNNNDAIRQENKKALPKFILIMAASLIVGILLGLGLVFLSKGNGAEALANAGLFFTTKVAGWLLMACPIVELAVCLPIYFSAKKQLAGWDGEDESVSSGAEAKLSVCIWITGLGTILSFFLLAALFSGFMDMEGNPLMVAPHLFIGGLAAFIVCLVVNMVLQQKLVDITKKLNPEKHGSVYDTKFYKKWMEGCDEAERAVIGQCAFKAYKAMCHACLGLWAVFALGAMYLNWGFMPAMAVCIVWGVGQSVYCYWNLNIAKPGSPSAY